MFNRKYSVTSANYLETLDKLEVKFHEIVEKIWNLEKLSMEPATTREKVLRYQAELAQLYGDLDKFQVFTLSLSFFLSFVISFSSS